MLANSIQSKTQVQGRLFAAVCSVIVAIANAASSDQSVKAYSWQNTPLPEVILAPMQVNEDSVMAGGWILIYRNTSTGPEEPDVEIQSRNLVDLGFPRRRDDAVISWEVLRTPNGPCAKAGSGPCPDRIRVLSVPDGFQAVPEAAWVPEGTYLSIRIVPALIG